MLKDVKRYTKRNKIAIFNKPSKIPIPGNDESEILTPRDTLISSRKIEKMLYKQSRTPHNPPHLVSQMKQLNEAINKNKVKMKAGKVPSVP